MASIKAIRDALQSTLADGISTVRAYDVVTGSERLSMPVVLLVPRTHEKITAGGSYRTVFAVKIHCSMAMGLARAQDVLDDLVWDGSTSAVEAVIEADITLGGVVDSAAAFAFEAYGFSELNGADTLMVTIPVEVLH